ncbi:helix-turn-helix transcriptional regulator [Mycobacterium sp. NPDC050041]|uniref:helix-turn-helix transcriptional regulator n=1 Tax=Mycobacterium sp. NPDC050041 TaxID=3364293 RepID=UPI003C2D788D
MNNTPDALRVLLPDVQPRLGGIGRTTVYNLIDQGELVRVHIGGRAFVTSESITAYVDRLKAAATAS